MITTTSPTFVGFFVCGMMCRFGIAMKKSYILLLFLTATILQGQPDALWQTAFGGGQYDERYFVQQTIDGGYTIAGYTWSFGSGRGDFQLIKTAMYEPVSNIVINEIMQNP